MDKSAKRKKDNGKIIVFADIFPYHTFFLPSVCYSFISIPLSYLLSFLFFLHNVLPDFVPCYSFLPNYFPCVLSSLCPTSFAFCPSFLPCFICSFLPSLFPSFCFSLPAFLVSFLSPFWILEVLYLKPVHSLTDNWKI
ncbi:hypothetical protein ILYODFUR_023616 [Ilyodon furcidens]|uniref:Uncharacterized protein n=1 Tax=Ilyodon furcidens TaxID=33524 RepID=A0ABV0UC01_9TELE